MALILIAGPGLAEEQSWLNNSLQVKLGELWSFKLTQELRARELTYDQTFLRNLNAGFYRKLPRGFSAGFTYKRETEEKQRFRVVEDRYNLEGLWKRGLKGERSFDLRARLEIRTFRDGRAEDHLRYRLRLRYRFPARLGRLPLEPFVWTELFGSTNAEPVLNRNRFSLGTAIPVAPGADLVIGYIRQDTRGSESLDILNTGVELSF